MQQRCTNPLDKRFKNYGARGIGFRFNSVLEASLWVMQNLGLQQDLELDRIDNNGHYEAGNMRYFTRREQMFNTRRTKSTLPDYLWAETESPLAFFTTRRYLIAGFSREEIIQQAIRSVQEKRKNWRGIKEKLEKLGYTTF